MAPPNRKNSLYSEVTKEGATTQANHPNSSMTGMQAPKLTDRPLSEAARINLRPACGGGCGGCGGSDVCVNCVGVHLFLRRRVEIVMVDVHAIRMINNGKERGKKTRGAEACVLMN